METILSFLHASWPWYISGPIIGLMVPAMILVGNRSFGISQNLEHLCAITQPGFIKVKFFKYDWRVSVWSLVFAAGVLLGGFLAGIVFPNELPLHLSQDATNMFTQWRLDKPVTYNPAEVFGLSLHNSIILLASGVFIGFGTRYASGCTSGHAITGLSTLQPASVFAVIGIFTGGLIASHFIVPYLFGGA